MLARNLTPNALDNFGIKAKNHADPLEVMNRANALFKLKKVPLSEWSGKDANDDLHVVVREDTNQAISTVGKAYTTFDNESFFVPVATALVNETGARIDRFQMLNNGTKSFMRISWPQDKNIVIGRPKVGDIVERRCTLSTSHDGTMCGRFSMQMLRLICSNGMTAPVGQYQLNLTHTISGEFQLNQMEKMAIVADRYVNQFEAAANIMVDTRITPKDDRTLNIIKRVVDSKEQADETKKGDPNQAQKRINRVMELFDGGQPGADTDELKNTAWGLYQSLNHYYTHDKNVRVGLPETDPSFATRQIESRFKNLIPGGHWNNRMIDAWNVVTDDLNISNQISEMVATFN